MVICLEQGADLHMTQLMPWPLTVSCFSKIQIGFGFTFLVPAHLGWTGKRAVKWVCCVFNWVVWWGAGMVICLERGADLHMAQLMPLPLTVSSVKSRLVLPFWYRLTRVVPFKGLLNMCVCMRASVRAEPTSCSLASFVSSKPYSPTVDAIADGSLLPSWNRPLQAACPHGHGLV